MTDILLSHIKIKDFRGIADFECDFSGGTVINGDNATGKSSIFAAFTWCLFGKDEKDRKDFEILPCLGGKTVKRGKASVTVTLSINGEATELRREYGEKWTRHRGDEDDTYEGCETACWWNETPVNVTEYGKRVAAIVDPQMFKMLTNPAYFPAMKWQDQRDMLTRLVPQPSDEELAAGDKAILNLLAEQSGKPLADFLKEKAGTLKRLRKEAAEVQPRIEEVKMTLKTDLPEEEYVRAKMEMNEKKAKESQNELTTLSGRQEAILKQLESKRNEIAQVEAEAAQLLEAARTDEAKRVTQANAQREAIQAELSVLKRKLETSANYILSFEKQTATYKAERDKLLKEHAALSEEYKTEAARTFDPHGMTCPTCGRPMTEVQLDEAAGEFNAAKAAKLAATVEKGTKLKERIENAAKLLQEREEKLRAFNTERDADADKYRELNNKLSAMPDKETARIIDAESVPGWIALKQKSAVLREEMHGTEAGGEDAETRKETSGRLKACMDNIAACKETLAEINANRKAEARISELEETGRDLAQKIAEYERLEFAAQKLERLRYEDVERRVNGLFRNVTFKLFDYTVEGKPVDTCVAVCGDAPYTVANSASKLNAGLDIIHTISEHLGYRCPIFIDNAEGVTSIDGLGMQLIKMYVVKGSKLTVNNQ